MHVSRVVGVRAMYSMLVMGLVVSKCVLVKWDQGLFHFSFLFV